MKQYRQSTLVDIVKKFQAKRVLVIGDLLLDQFIWGDVSRISPEAPVPVVWVKNEGFMPGGACNVASNLSELGAKVSLAGLVGDDEKGRLLVSQLEDRGIITDQIMTDKSRPTILKTRVIANHQQVVRIDRENINEVSARYINRIRDYVAEHIKDIDGLIIEDYGKGLVTPSLLKKIVPLAKKHKKIIAVDPKENHFSYYKGVSVITPNHKEAEKAVGFTMGNDNALKKGGEKLLKNLKVDVVLLTLGEQGMMVFEKNKKAKKIPTLAQEVFDVSGAGDTVIAAYTLSVISGASPIVAAHISNCAAGIVVGKESVAVVRKDELINRLKIEAGKGRK